MKTSFNIPKLSDEALKIIWRKYSRALPSQRQKVETLILKEMNKRAKKKHDETIMVIREKNHKPTIFLIKINDEVKKWISEFETT